MARHTHYRRAGGRSVLLALALLAGAATAAHAQSLIISNLANTAEAVPTSFVTTQDRYAQNFYMDTTVTTTASTNLYATLSLSLVNPLASASDTVHLYLYSDYYFTTGSSDPINGTMPYQPIADLGTKTVTGTTAANYTFTSSSSVSLTAGQFYWLVLQDDANSNAGWYYTYDTTTTGTGAELYSDFSTGASFDSGATWFTQAVDQGVQRFELGTAAAELPEPGSLPLLLAGGALLPVAVRHRSRRRRTNSVPRR